MKHKVKREEKKNKSKQKEEQINTLAKVAM